MTEEIFKFRNFEMQQSPSGQRINTDSCVFGDLITTHLIKNPLASISILEIGAGSGVVSLMMAEKFPETKIVAVEIDADTAEICRANFSRSPWHDRLEIICADARQMLTHDTLDLWPNSGHPDVIVCNPPFFIQSQRSKDEHRAKARHDISFGPDDLAAAATKLLRNDGILWVMSAAGETARFLAPLGDNFALEESICLAHSADHMPHSMILKLRKVAHGGAIRKDCDTSRIDYHAANRDLSDWMKNHRKKWFPY